MNNWGQLSSRRADISKAAGIAVILAAFGLLLVRPSLLTEAYLSYRTDQLIRSAQSQSRSTHGRLFNAPYAPISATALVPDDLGRAQLYALRLPNSPVRDYLQSRIDIGNRNWKRAVQTLTKLASAQDADPRMLNDLGVVLLQLADDDPLYVFKALEEFETAEKRDPDAPEPRFNSLLVLRKLQLVHREETEVGAYSKIEKSGPWHDELLLQGLMEEERVAADLQAALDRHDEVAAQTIFTRSPELCRKIAMRYAMNPRDAGESEKIASFIGQTLKNRYGDETVAAMLETIPLPNAPDLIEARRLVTEGAGYYEKADHERSLSAYEKAISLVETGGSAFDRAWISVNKADTEVRLNRIDDAKNSLQDALFEAQRKNLKWVQALALVPYGSHRGLNSGFGEMMDRLEEAVRLFNEIGSPRDSVRARYYMMGYRFFAGDLDGALRMAVECLSLTDPANHILLASLHNFVSVILYKKGFVDQSIFIGDESVNQAVESHNLPLVATTSSALATIEELNGQINAADAYLSRSEEATRSIGQSIEHIRAEAILNNAKARVFLNRGRLLEAEDLLKKSRQFFDSQSRPSISYSVETSMLLGQTYAVGKKIQEGRDAFRHAIEIDEEGNNFVKAERVRLAFDDGRRELFDSAIAFEYGQGATDTAWAYVQKYRAKLFIEILAQFNPAVEKVHSIALDRNQVQHAIPKDLQVVEYALLPDRLLIWVITNDRFETRSIPIKRVDLEQKVQDFLGSLRAIRPSSDQSLDLYKTLITPVEDLLDPARALAIIPDRALHGLPFAALECPDSGFLINKFAVVVSPTLTHFLAVNKTNGKRDAIVTFGARTGDVADSREIGAVESLYSRVSSFRGPQVTKASFLTEMSRAPVFHYAGHSVHDAIDPLRSSILLDGDKGGPNSVTAIDISARKLLPNALVVLSSCDSSVGNSKDGIGIRGLTSAFLIGGAGAVVGSLWPVESTSTAELMIDFHRSFAGEHLPIAQSLRKAQLDYIAANPRRAHPYYWSGFVVTGNHSALH